MTAIVIVEDDVLANEHLEFILQQAGYEVFSATSADEAAELLDDHEDVQLLVTDINLPGTVDGLKLAAAVKARRPEMNIIITTGYSAPKDEEIPQGSLFLPKPYNARKMIEAVRHFQQHSALEHSGMTPRAVAIIRNTMTTLEYKGFRIEVTSVGKGWRGAIFEPGSTRAFSIFAMFQSNKDDRELEAWFDCNGHKWTEGPCHSDPDACHYSSEELCEFLARELPRAE